MAVTLLQAVKRVCRRVGLDPGITAFSDSDETNDIVEDLNDAYEELRQNIPNAPAFRASGTLSLVQGQRLYSLPAGAYYFDLYSWSIANDTADNEEIRRTSEEAIEDIYRDYKEAEGRPRYLYPTGNSQVGIYPVPDAAYTLSFYYATNPGRLSATTDTFLVPDEWARFLVARAQYRYEARKGFSTAQDTFALSEREMVNIKIQIRRAAPVTITGDTFVYRRRWR